MVEGTGSRLDTVDIGDGAGWQVESTHEADVFTKGPVAIEVRYSATDEVVRAVKRDANGERDTIDEQAVGKADQLRAWLTGRPMTVVPFVRYPEAYSTFESGGWTRQEFVAAVEDPKDRAFLLRFFDLMDANGQLRSLGSHSRLHFGKKPGGAVFVYPFGRRFPPFKFSVKDGYLMISGCWKGNFKVSGHAGFAEIASLLGQDENGPASAVLVAGLDPDELWDVGDRVSRAIS